MDRTITDVVTLEVIPVARAALRELTELRSAVQLLGEHIDGLTAGLADGGLPELIRLAAGALRTLDTANHGGGRP